MCCPVRFSEELIAIFLVKLSQIDTENDKNPKVFQFSLSVSFFSKSPTDIVNWNVEEGQQRKNVLSKFLEKK